MNDDVRAVENMTAQIQKVVPDLVLVSEWLEAHADRLSECYISFRTSGVGFTLGVQIQVGYGADNPAEAMADIARLLAEGAPIGSVRKLYDDNYMRLFRSFGSVEVEAWTTRDRVCERVVVGVEEVEVPDPDAPMVTVEQEKYEWVCAPILAAAVTE